MTTRPSSTAHPTDHDDHLAAASAPPRRGGDTPATHRPVPRLRVTCASRRTDRPTLAADRLASPRSTPNPKWCLERRPTGPRLRILRMRSCGLRTPSGTNPLSNPAAAPFAWLSGTPSRVIGSALRLGEQRYTDATEMRAPAGRLRTTAADPLGPAQIRSIRKIVPESVTTKPLCPTSSSDVG